MMHSLYEIKRQNAEAGKKAKRSSKKPLIGKKAKANLKAIPDIGDHEPDGFTETGTFFVDHSGFGSEGGAALTITQFIAKVKDDHYYAITSTGQFQLYITEYSK